MIILISWLLYLNLCVIIQKFQSYHLIICCILNVLCSDSWPCCAQILCFKVPEDSSDVGFCCFLEFSEFNKTIFILFWIIYLTCNAFIALTSILNFGPILFSTCLTITLQWSFLIISQADLSHSPMSSRSWMLVDLAVIVFSLQRLNGKWHKFSLAHSYIPVWYDNIICQKI